jgi:hypothetical protein
MLNMMVVFVLTSCCLWYTTFGSSSIHIPVGYGRLDRPFVNFTVFALSDPSIHFGAGYIPSGILSINKNSWLRENFGPIASTNTEIVLNSSRSEFIQTCYDGDSNVSVALDNRTTEDTFQGYVRFGNNSLRVSDIQFHLRSAKEMIGTVPYELMNDIFEIFRTLGGRMVMPNERVLTNVERCAPHMLESLPDIVIGFGTAGEVVLTPHDYIVYLPHSNQCEFKIWGPAALSGGDYYFVNPFMIKGMNFRISSDLLEICDSNNIS